MFFFQFFVVTFTVCKAIRHDNYIGNSHWHIARKENRLFYGRRGYVQQPPHDLHTLLNKTRFRVAGAVAELNASVFDLDLISWWWRGLLHKLFCMPFPNYRVWVKTSVKKNHDNLRIISLLNANLWIKKKHTNLV